MTKEEINQAFAMRLQKKTYFDIGQALNINPHVVYDTLRRIVHEHGKTIRRSRKERYPYENLENWMIENGVTAAEFARRCKCGERSMALVLNGDRKPSEAMTVAIVRVTGLSKEDAFKKREGWA